MGRQRAVAGNNGLFSELFVFYLFIYLFIGGGGLEGWRDEFIIKINLIPIIQ